MAIRSFSFFALFVAGVVFAGCASSGRGDMSDSGGQSSGVTVAADPLTACMASISKDASAGQRALAEQTCQRDFGKKDTRAVAAGTPGDTLQACLARIPKEATAGQRMIAEQSCQRDEEQRRRF